MPILKHLFLGMTLLSVVNATSTTETLAKKDFESFVNKGLSDFMNQFGREKKAELGIVDLVEKQKLEKEERLKLEKEKQEKLALWSSGIETTIKHVKDLKNYDFTYAKLLEVLKVMKKYHEERNIDESILEGIEKKQEETARYIERNSVLVTTLGYIIEEAEGWEKAEIPQVQRQFNYCTIYRQVGYIREILIEKIKKKMEAYKIWMGALHPLWDEFNKM